GGAATVVAAGERKRAREREHGERVPKVHQVVGAEVSVVPLNSAVLQSCAPIAFSFWPMMNLTSVNIQLQRLSSSVVSLLLLLLQQGGATAAAAVAAGVGGGGGGGKATGATSLPRLRRCCEERNWGDWDAKAGESAWF
ncbi:unnamed protein product, partial [Phaeothamnion confervicola]